MPKVNLTRHLFINNGINWFNQFNSYCYFYQRYPKFKIYKNGENNLKKSPEILAQNKNVIKNLEFRKSPKLIFGEVFNIVNTIDYFLLLLR